MYRLAVITTYTDNTFDCTSAVIPSNTRVHELAGMARQLGDTTKHVVSRKCTLHTPENTFEINEEFNHD